MVYQVSANTQKIINQASETIIEGAIAGSVGYFIARSFKIVNPVQAAVLSAISMVVSKLTQPLFDSLFNNRYSNTASKIVGAFLNVTAYTAIYTGAAYLAGYSVSVAAFLALNDIAVASYALVKLGLMAGPHIMEEFNT